jgi:hypothetical protein
MEFKLPALSLTLTLSKKIDKTARNITNKNR